MAQVEGLVTLDGEPVTDIFVVFSPQPKEGEIYAETKSATGRVDESGRYFLETKEKNDGAVVGAHTVTIVNVDRNAPPPGSLPPGFTVEVKPGTNDIPLELTKN